MNGLTGIFVVLGVLWLLQLGLAWHQAMRFQKQVSALRRDGAAVAIGMARTRFRKVYVALAEQDERISAALVLTGRTVFASGRPVPELTGLRVGAVAKRRLLPELPDLVAEAAAQAAGFLIDARDRTKKKAAAALLKETTS